MRRTSLTIALFSPSNDVYMCQTFQYSRGWTNGKRSFAVSPPGTAIYRASEAIGHRDRFAGGAAIVARAVYNASPRPQKRPINTLQHINALQNGCTYIKMPREQKKNEQQQPAIRIFHIAVQAKDLQEKNIHGDQTSYFLADIPNRHYEPKTYTNRNAYDQQ
uniref:Pro-corazonin n=1 Tax=Dysdercus cingulatus TaxID=191328 RepID=C0LM12_9HEMI|nr:corazonin [Dysdercus cingulatus]